MPTDIITDKDENRAIKFVYSVDLSTYAFSENSASGWIQAMPYGKWQHPVHGEIEFTPERARRFADNITKDVRGHPLDIDYEHKARDTIAAGWVKSAEVKDTGLWLFVEWTQAAAEKIRNKEFRYFSPEYQDKWLSPMDGKMYSDVLFGGGLTNRPFLKGIKPINLSELQTDEDEINMNRDALEKLAKLHNITFDENTKDADLSAKVSEAVISATDSDDSTEDVDDTKKVEKETVVAETDVVDSELVSASDETTAKLLSDNAELLKRLELVEAANKLSETNLKLSELNAGNKRLSPQATKLLSEVMVQSNEAISTAVFKFAETVLENGIVELGETGGSATTGSNGLTFEAEVKKLTDADDKVSYLDAVTTVSENNPALWAEYNNAILNGGI